MSDDLTTAYLTGFHKPDDEVAALKAEIERLRQSFGNPEQLLDRARNPDAGAFDSPARYAAYLEGLCQELADEVERLRQRLSERLIAYCVCNNCNSPVDGCNCVACTTKRLEDEIERLRRD